MNAKNISQILILLVLGMFAMILIFCEPIYSGNLNLYVLLVFLTKMLGAFTGVAFVILYMRWSHRNSILRTLEGCSSESEEEAKI